MDAAEIFVVFQLMTFCINNIAAAAKAGSQTIKTIFQRMKRVFPHVPLFELCPKASFKRIERFLL